jgi:hypothetical protein
MFYYFYFSEYAKTIRKWANFHESSQNFAKIKNFMQLLAKTKNLTKSWQWYWMPGECGVILYITLHFGRIERTYWSNKVEMKFFVCIFSRKFLHLREKFCEHFFQKLTKIVETYCNDADEWGIRLSHVN